MNLIKFKFFISILSLLIGLNDGWSSSQEKQYEIITLVRGNASSSVYLIKNLMDKSKSILVDASTIRKNKLVLGSINYNDLEYEDIALMVITHSHCDHCSGLPELKKKLTNMKVLIHKDEVRNLKSGKFEMPTTLFKTLDKVLKPIEMFNSKYSFFDYQGVDPDIIMENEKYPLKEYGFDENCYILHTPGHTEGSISIILGKCAIVGDTMVNTFLNSNFLSQRLISYRALFGEQYNEKKILKQWNRLLELGCTKFYPGHGDVIELNLNLIIFAFNCVSSADEK